MRGFADTDMVIGQLDYQLTLVAFLLCNTVLVGRIFNQIEKLDVPVLMWRLFIIGMIGVAIIMVITLVHPLLDAMALAPQIRGVFFSLGLYVLLLFFLSTTFIFRRFIFYPRTRRKLIAWRIFLAFLALSLVFQVYSLGYVTIGAYLPFVGVVFFLSTNVRWSAYLNFNQKLRVLGLFGLLVLVVATYLIAANRLPDQMEVLRPPGYAIIFINYLIIFTISYMVFSILVLFFNLPTTSIFERESIEIASFHKINQAIQSNLDFTEIINTLLDASVMASSARAGWIELLSEQQAGPEVKIYKRTNLKEIEEIKQGHPLTLQVIENQKPLLIRNLARQRDYRGYEGRYRCLLVVPILSNSQAYGAIFVVNELASSFEDVTTDTLTTYAEQAGMALENAQLIKASIEMERYQEQLKIAKEVQDQLLPRRLPLTRDIEFIAMSENAQEVGGDYFDVVEPREGLYRVAIGDVSGKGTTAAFYMAEIKGIFHALTRLELSPQDFITTANKALSECIQEGFFITFTYLQVDTHKRTVEWIRAGHCPAYLYRAETGQIEMLREGTLGLGIVRNDSFANFVQRTERMEYQAGDFLVLYTDGITEARNEDMEEYGYDRLSKVICTHAQLSAAEIAARLVGSVKDFTHSDLQDDYTILIIRFK